MATASSTASCASREPRSVDVDTFAAAPLPADATDATDVAKAGAVLFFAKPCAVKERAAVADAATAAGIADAATAPAVAGTATGSGIGTATGATVAARTVAAWTATAGKATVAADKLLDGME